MSKNNKEAAIYFLICLLIFIIIISLKSIINKFYISIILVIFYILTVLMLIIRSNKYKKELIKVNKRSEIIYKHQQYEMDKYINLSHELKNNLNVIITAIQLLNKCYNNQIHISKNKLNEYIHIIETNSKKLLQSINYIINISKVEGNFEQESCRVNFKEVDIIYLVEDTVMNMKDYIESKGIKFIIDPKVEEKVIICDPIGIQTCVVNLVGNAVKFTPSRGNIYISIYDNISEIKISVKDTGIGILKEEQELIFDRYFQCKNNTHKLEGNGIGLALVNKVVNEHKGRIIINSEGANMGSEFTIILPIKQ